VSHDGFPRDVDPRAFAGAMIAHRDNLSPLLTIYPAGGCECTLGRVYRVNGMTVLTGIAVVPVLVGMTDGKLQRERHKQRYAVLLDQPDRPVTLVCRHGGTGGGELLGETLARVRAAVAAATRTGTVLVI
jgi:hypothetical protein